MAEDLPELNERVFVEGMLTAMLNTRSANTVAAVPGVRFRKGDSYKAAVGDDGKFALGVIDNKSIKQVEITPPGGAARYFRQVASADDAAIPSDGLKPTGFKAIAWIETGKDGTALPKDGRANVILAFAGYDGHPYDGSPQTNSMYAVSDAKRYPQMDAVPHFLEQTRNALAKEPGVSATDTHIVSHSLGASNALKAAVDLERSAGKASSVLLLEPVGASLAGDKLAEGEAGKEAMGAVLAKTTSLRVVTENMGELAYSKSAMLQTYGEHNPGRTPEQVRQDNIKNTAFGPPRVGKIDPNNESVGRELLMNVMGHKIIAVSLGARLDGTHATGSITNAAANNASIDTPENIKEAAKARAAKDPKMSQREPTRGIPLERAMARISRLMPAMGLMQEDPMQFAVQLASSTLKAVLSERAVLQGTQIASTGQDYSVTAMQEDKKTSVPGKGPNSTGRMA